MLLDYLRQPCGNRLEGELVFMSEPTKPDKAEKPAEPENKIVEPPPDPSTDTQRLRPVSRDEAAAAFSQALLSERIKKLMEKAGSAPASSSTSTQPLTATQPLKRDVKAEAPSPAPAETSKPSLPTSTAVKPAQAAPSPSSGTAPVGGAPAPLPAAKPAEPAASLPPVSKPAEVQQTKPQPTPTQPQPAPASVSGAGDVQPWRVIFQTVTDQPKAIGTEVRHAVVIGRTDPRSNLKPDIDLAPHDAQAYGVSRQHALLLPTDSGLSLIDLDSTNGTWINGLYLQPGLRYNLRSGDRIELGTLKLIVRVVGPVSGRENSKEVTAVSRTKPKRM
jgi:pSer/pThr/pTyr-binding forkhead associated (FHA) protein